MNVRIRTWGEFFALLAAALIVGTVVSGLCSGLIAELAWLSGNMPLAQKAGLLFFVFGVLPIASLCGYLIWWNRRSTQNGPRSRPG